jgi:hypothetical protein
LRSGPPQCHLGRRRTRRPLSDAYRQFYGQLAAPELALHFIGERLVNDDSTIFIAVGEALGFTRLYPSFSSVSAGASTS